MIKAVRALLLCGLLVPLAHAALPLARPAPQVDARAYLLEDVQSGQVLAAADIDQRVAPASLAKLMTAYLIFQALDSGKLKPDQPLTVSPAGWKSTGARMFLSPLQPASLEQVLQGMIVLSANDAAITLAEAHSGSEAAFAADMNIAADKLGLKNTHFRNATGLDDPEQYTSAADLATLARTLLRKHPEHYRRYGQRYFSYRGIRQPSTNALLFRDARVDGMKTGTTDAAGFHLLASAAQGQHRVLSVVLGARSETARLQGSASLVNYGLQEFETIHIYQAGQQLSQLQVYKGSSRKVAAGPRHDVYVTVPRGRAGELTVELHSTQPLVAPLSKHQNIGSLVLKLDGRVVTERPIVALKAVPVGGFFARLWDALMLWLGH